MKVAIIPDPEKNLLDFGLEVGNWLKDKYSVLPNWGFDEKEIDMAILLGGDGFIMKKSLYLATYKIPFLAINCGTKGFLAVAEKDNWHEVLEKVLNGRYTIDKRQILSVSHFDAANKSRNFKAAGNVYIRHRAYMILFTVSIDGKIIYKELGGDGVIVANVTGATAYNLAADGALITGGLVITPICPHALNAKSLPVPKSAKKIEIFYHGRKGGQEDDEGCLLFSDSEKFPILPGERLEIRPFKKEALLVTQEGFSCIESLQKKLGLST